MQKLFAKNPKHVTNETESCFQYDANYQALSTQVICENRDTASVLDMDITWDRIKS